MVDQHQHSGWPSWPAGLLADVLDTVTDGVLVLDDAGRVLGHNAAAHHLLREGQVTGTRPLDGGWRLTDLDGTAVIPAALGTAPREVRVDAGHGSSVTVLLSVHPMPAPSTDAEVDGPQPARVVLVRPLPPPPIVSGPDHDALTSLATRARLLERLEEALADGDQPIAVMALNLDRFKAVNAGLGQSLADEVLREVARRLRACLGEGDVAARLGADDFLLLFTGVATRLHAGALANRVLESIGEPIDVGDLRIQVTASAGITLVDPHNQWSGDIVVTEATAALNTAKGRGRARFEIFDADIARSSSMQLQIETSLRSALAHGELRVAFQPIRHLARGTIVGAEALTRWTDPRLGPVTPEQFIPVAMDSGLVQPLTDFVLEEAVRAAAGWRAETGADVHVAVNLSAQDLSRRHIAGEVAEVLGRHGLPPRALQVEIVETALLDPGEGIRRHMLALRELGVSLGIDDFGTGYSSMTYLKSLPVDFVKIDKAFVTGLGEDREDTAIVRAVIGLAKSLDLTVVAEGIQTPMQVRMLTELGCDLAQGYLIGHAEPAEVLASTLAAQQR